MKLFEGPISKVLWLCCGVLFIVYLVVKAGLPTDAPNPQVVWCSQNDVTVDAYADAYHVDFSVACKALYNIP